MSSFPYVWDADGVPKGDARFYLALFGQAITGIACPFVSSVPTKVLTRLLGVIVQFQCLINMNKKVIRIYHRFSVL